uniref:GTPase activating Rap/RanGAP domain like 3 n=1 Tax=Naja naja TaxID=35670 RepID=A0A8C6XRU3_NAJNA
MKQFYSSSVSEDLGCRRGEFSRKHYGSVELLISSDADGAIQRAGRFRVENGSVDENADYTPGTWHRTDVHLENPGYHTRWYFKYFLGKVHQNYVGMDAEKNPFFLSVVLSDQNNQRVPQYRAILWRKTGTQKICLPYSPTKTLSVKSILSAMNLDKFEKGPREILHPEIQKGSVNFKFGILYAKDGQLTDDEMFSNETGSETFQRLLSLLGDTVTLKGWTGYRGGLDTKMKTKTNTGRESNAEIYLILLLQVERKRHIGNDIVTIVFQEGEETSPAFKPSMIRSHFTHIFALVRYNKQSDSYRLKIFSEESVPLFGPPLPSPPVFTDHQEFRDFLLVKLINGEKATLETPTFAQKRQRTIDMLIRSLYQDLMPDIPFLQLPAEFVRFGQALKLKTIVRGDAPTILATTSLCKKEPWESQCFCSNFPHEVICADSWGQSLLVSTDVGVFLLDDGQPPIPVFDKTLQIKQMHVLETLDLLITRADKGKEARLVVFRLNALWKGIEAKSTRSKSDCRENKLEKTKGCHLYAINTHHSNELRIIAAIRNKLLLVTRKFRRWETLNGAPLASPQSESPIEEFQYIREICLSDPPVVMTLVDGPTGENDNLICVAYRHQFDLVSESTGECYRMHNVDASRVNFVAAIDVYEDGEAGLLLCYNYVCYYRKVCPFNGAQLWSICAFPYILAFTTDSIEIRLVVNGNLVHTAVVPALQLVASRSDIYFRAATAVSEVSNSSSKETSSPGSPQTPSVQENLIFSPSAAEGKEIGNIYKIPLSNLVGRSIERPLKSPMVPKVITTPTSAPIPVAPSLSLSRIEIKEIASRTRKELLGLLNDPSLKSEGGPKQKKLPLKQSDPPKQGTLRSSSSDR